MKPYALGLFSPHMQKNPFGLAHQEMQQRGAAIESQLAKTNPFLEQKERKEKQFGAQKPDTPWLQQPGMFGIDRQAAMMGGLGLLMGGY